VAENSAIEWTDATFNPWIGCTKVGPGCDHCYAEARMDKRLHRVVWGAGQARTLTKTWSQPLRWNRLHEEFFAAHGRRQRVFCASLADVFDNEVPPVWRADLFRLIDSTPHLDWLLLTKRIGNVSKMLTEILRPGTMPANVWLGATVVNQEEADRDIPKLLAAPARARFLSMEPLLGPVKLALHGHRVGIEGSALRGVIDWIIVGGESGHDARPMHPDWARSLRDQCTAAGVPFLFKQWGQWRPTDADYVVDDRQNTLPMHRWADGRRAVNVGKKAAGRLLDGRSHDGFPT